jgi:UDP-GlcNAc3NAcA epimerase
MKIVSIVGARPQFIKLAPLSRKLRTKHQEIIIHTGQHYDDAMSASLFADLNIPAPDYNLDIRSSGHGVQTGRMLEHLESVLIKEGGDLVIVFGDTNTTLAGALAAVKLHLPVLHIEAGLRSYNRKMPEEINRVAVDHISDYLFAPTSKAMTNLRSESLITRTRLTGDIMVDALRENSETARLHSRILQRFGLRQEEFYLLTLHRPYNVDDKETLRHILSELERLDKPVIFPVHPRTNRTITTLNVKKNPHCIMIQPLGYLDFICLMLHADKIITDSGGIQKEAYLLRKPCITLRTETEWTETVDEGWNILAAATSAGIAETVMAFRPQQNPRDIFGSCVAQNMFDCIEQF